MFIEYVGREEVERFITTMTSIDGAVTEYPGKFTHFLGEGKVVQSKPHNSYALMDYVELEEKNRDGYVCCRFPQCIGNRNERLSKDERGVRME